MKIVSVVVINSNEEYLVLKRSSGRKYFPYKWNFISGKIKGDEIPLDCAKREIKEELGDKVKLEFIRAGNSFVDEISGQEKWEVYPFLFKYLSGEIKIDNEHTEYNFFSINEIKSLDRVPGLDLDLESVI